MNDIKSNCGDALAVPLTFDSEHFAAYIVAIAADPEIIHAPAIVRMLLVAQIIAGQRLAQDSLMAMSLGDRTRCATVLALMAQDEATAELNGWLW